MDVLILLLLVINQLTAQFPNPDDLKPVPYAYRKVTNEGYIYKCYDGFVHTSGNLTRNLSSGTFIGTPPVCTRDPGPPPLLALTSLIPNNDTINNDTIAGSKATYNCSVGDIVDIECPNGYRGWPIRTIDCRDTKRLEILSANLSSRQEPNSNLAISVDLLNGSLSDHKTLSSGQCISTASEKKPYIDLNLGPENFEIHRLAFTTPTDMNYTASRINVKITTHGSALKPTSFCWNGVKRLTSGQVVSINCSGYQLTAVGTNVRLTVTFPFMKNNRGMLQICDLHVYGAKFNSSNVECGNLPTYYGMRVHQPVHSTRYLGQAVYVCEDGFFHTGGSGISTCGIGGIWTEPDRDCSDEKSLVNTETILLPLPAFVDGNTTTCDILPGTLKLELGGEYEVANFRAVFKGVDGNITLVVKVRDKDGITRQCGSYTGPTETSDEDTQSAFSNITVDCEPRRTGNAVVLHFNTSESVHLCETYTTEYIVSESEYGITPSFPRSERMMNLEFDTDHERTKFNVVVSGEAITGMNCLSILPENTFASVTTNEFKIIGIKLNSINDCPDVKVYLDSNHNNDDCNVSRRWDTNSAGETSDRCIFAADCLQAQVGNKLHLEFPENYAASLNPCEVKFMGCKVERDFVPARRFNTSLVLDDQLSTCAKLSGTLGLEFYLQQQYEVEKVTVSFGRPVEHVTLKVLVKKTGFAPRLCETYTGEVTLASVANTSTFSFPLTVDCMDRRPVGRVLRLLLSGLESTVQICEIWATGRKFERPLECSQTEEGWDYKGTVNMSISGQTCLRWDQVNGGVIFEDKMFNDDLQENYCRVPDVPESHSVGNTIRPWCYTADGRREYCPVAHCDKLCLQGSTGTLYSGKMSHKNCNKWNESPFSLSSAFDPSFSDDNHCRNPGKSRLKPWCYINDVEIADCDIPPCLTWLPKPAFQTFHYVHSHGIIEDQWECYFYNLFNVNNARKAERKIIDSNSFKELMLDTCKDNRNVTYLCRSFPPETITWEYGTLECVNCGYPPTIEGASASSTSQLPGDVATYACKDDKVLIGDNSTTCLESGNWTTVSATCKFNCGPPPTVEGARTSSTSQLPGDVMTYTCDDDKVLVGDNATICLESGNWTTVTASCKLNCGPTPTVEGANASSTSQRPGDVATYACVDDKILVGDNSTRCLENGNWTSVYAACKLKCGLPPTIKGANASSTSQLPGDVATYTCDTDRVLVGDSSTVCLESGNWTSVNASCKFNCGSPPTIEGANASSTSQLPGDVTTYTCNDDKVLVGDNSTTCLESGNWTTVSTTCKFNCGPPPTVEGARTASTSQLPGDVMTYTCDDDKVLVGDNATTCLESGNWTTVTASCKLNCGPTPTVEGANASSTSQRPGDVATYACVDDKVLVGDNSTRCLENGNWTSVYAACKLKCGLPPTIKGANASSTSQLPGDVATYTCDTDKVLVGDSSTVCLESGNWTSVNASCKFNCGPPPTIEGAKASNTSQVPGAIATYICDDKKQLVGDKTTTCLESGNWTSVNAYCKLIKVSRKCVCRKPASTLKDLAKAIMTLKKNLTLKKENLLKTKMMKQSRMDKRISSAVMGYTAIIVVFVGLGSLIIHDIISLLAFIYRRYNGVGPKRRRNKIYCNNESITSGLVEKW